MDMVQIHQIENMGKPISCKDNKRGVKGITHSCFREISLLLMKKQSYKKKVFDCGCVLIEKNAHQNTGVELGYQFS